jgi:hypothetical protein
MLKRAVAVSGFVVAMFVCGMGSYWSAAARADGVAGPCDSNDLQGVSCTNPGDCINACSFWCSDGTTCLQCCTAFFGHTIQYNACRQSCNDVWPQPKPG